MVVTKNTMFIIFGLLMLGLVVVMFLWNAVPWLQNVTFDACWIKTVRMLNDIQKDVGAPRFEIEKVQLNRTVALDSTCTVKIQFISHEELMGDRYSYTAFLDVCELGNYYLLAYPVAEDPSWVFETLKALKEAKRKYVLRVLPVCVTFDSDLTIIGYRNLKTAEGAYCIEYDEEDRTKLRIEKGRCEGEAEEKPSGIAEEPKLAGRPTEQEAKPPEDLSDKPELKIVRFHIVPERPIDIKITVQNTGPTESGPVRVDLFAERVIKEEDLTKEGKKYRLGEWGKEYKIIDNILSGRSRTVTFKLSMLRKSGISPLPHYWPRDLYAIVDTLDAVKEADEDNNIAESPYDLAWYPQTVYTDITTGYADYIYIRTFIPTPSNEYTLPAVTGRPDLTVGSIKIEKQLETPEDFKDPVKVTATIVNNGLVDVGSFRVDLFQFNINDLPPAFKVDGTSSTTVSGLLAGKSTEVQFTDLGEDASMSRHPQAKRWDVDPGYEQGKNYFIIVDPHNRIEEMDEVNNIVQADHFVRWEGLPKGPPYIRAIIEER